MKVKDDRESDGVDVFASSRFDIARCVRASGRVRPAERDAPPPPVLDSATVDRQLFLLSTAAKPLTYPTLPTARLLYIFRHENDQPLLIISFALNVDINVYLFTYPPCILYT